MSELLTLTHFDVDKNLEQFLSGPLYSFPVTMGTMDQIPNKDTIRAVSVKSFSKITSETLDALPNLELLITRTVGTDHIDIEYCKERGVAVYHIPDYGAHNIAEHAMGLILCGARCIVQADRQVQSGVFSHVNFLGFSLRGKTLGVIGVGKIGSEVIQLAHGFGMRTIAYDKKCDMQKAKDQGYACLTLDEVFAEADVLSLHVPLLPETRHMIGDKQFQQMKKNVILVNTARGGIIDTTALIHYIDKCKAVCLDVLEEEDAFSADHPLLQFPNVIITPHIGFYTDTALQKIADITLRCAQRYAEGDNEGRVV